ncbi:MAG: hypothetical protein JWN91_963 [Nocardioides sp.]|nr:hypothetical protein [Nocardioides sp.]
MRTVVRRAGLAVGVVGALALIALIANASLGDTDADGQTDGPVISLGDDWNAYPTALVTGRISLEDGCLLIGTSVVFWPHQTRWDEGRQAVEFGGDFDSSPAAPLGEEFTGGGGFYSSENIRDMESLDDQAVLRCIRDSGAEGAVFAYPGE